MALIDKLYVIQERAGVEDGFTVDQAVALVDLCLELDGEGKLDYASGSGQGSLLTILRMAKRESAVDLLSDDERATLARAANQVLIGLRLEQ